MGQDIPPGKITRAIYLHIPFCLSKCNYCSFFSVPYDRQHMQSYLAYLHKELELFMGSYPIRPASIYFGGGTPSLLTAAEIQSLIDKLLFGQDIGTVEITLEINPIQITKSFMDALAITGINRLSIGLQAMNDAQLAWLSRKHKVSQIPGKIRLLKEYGYRNISCDLIYGLPGSGVQDLKDNLLRFLELEPQHISTYLLCLEESPGLRDSIPLLPDDEMQALQYDTIRRILDDNGFEQYEISNFALDGFESRHNLCYWNWENYLGLGASAAGWIEPFCYTNPASLEQYYSDLDKGITMASCELCEEKQQKEDYLMMGLRKTRGIKLAEYQARFGTDLLKDFESVINLPLMDKVLNISSTHLALKPEFMFVSNQVIGKFLS